MLNTLLRVAVYAAILVFTPSICAAADLPSRKSTPVIPPSVVNWTGFYAGANVGVTFADPANISSLGTSLSPSTVGFAGGLQGGYNLQIDRIVVGGEADFNGLVNHASISTAFSTFTQNPSYYGTLRLRAGFLITPSLLIYGTGGLAYGQENASVSSFSPSALSASFNSTQVGWVAGGGIEYMLPNYFVFPVSVKLEGLHYQLGPTVATLYSVTSLPNFGNAIVGSGTVSGARDNNVVRLGVNVHF